MAVDSQSKVSANSVAGTRESRLPRDRPNVSEKENGVSRLVGSARERAQKAANQSYAIRNRQVVGGGVGSKQEGVGGNKGLPLLSSNPMIRAQ